MKILLLIWGFFFPYKTKKERKEIYKKVGEYMKTEFPDGGYVGAGFCRAFMRVEHRTYGWVGKLWRFPELYWYRPFFKGTHALWWDIDKEGMQKRINIVDKISI